MVDTTGPTPADNMIQRLLDHGDHFDLYHAIRLLNCRLKDRPAVGEARLPSQEFHRFTQHVSLAFPRSTIEQISKDPDGKLRISTNGFGLLGPNGPMPMRLPMYRAKGSRLTMCGSELREAASKLICCWPTAQAR